MSTTTGGNFPTVTPKELQSFSSELRNCTLLEEIHQVIKPSGFPMDNSSKVYFENLDRVMRLAIQTIRTPEDVLRVHLNFKKNSTFSNTIQNELGEKAREVYGEWRPPSTGGYGIRD